MRSLEDLQRVLGARRRVPVTSRRSSMLRRISLLASATATRYRAPSGSQTSQILRRDWHTSPMVDTSALSAHHLDQLRRACGEVITAERRLRRRTPPVERDPRSAAGGHRSADSQKRRPSGSRGSTTCDRGPVGRPQRGGTPRPRRRDRHRPVRDARGRSRRPDQDRPGKRRCLPRRARRRRAGPRARLPGRRRGSHGRRRADPGWRGRQAPAPLRADDRQPGRRRDRHR